MTINIINKVYNQRARTQTDSNSILFKHDFVNHHTVYFLVQQEHYSPLPQTYNKPCAKSKS